MARKLSAKLFDGRDLYYFDDQGSNLPAERKPDARETAERPETAVMRLDALSGDWISIAAHRHGRRPSRGPQSVSNTSPSSSRALTPKFAT